MENKKSLTLNGLVPLNFLYLLLSVAMIFVGAYLTGHFFDTFYPDGISGSSSLCNINDFWACDQATQSPLGSIGGMPTSIFGIIMGVIGIFAAFAGSKAVERTTKTVLLVNFIACLVLFLYSLLALGSLCPMCTAYYVISAICYFLFHKYSHLGFGIDPKIGGLYFALVLIPLIGMNFYIGNKEAKKVSLTDSYVKQFKALKDYGDPEVESEFKIHVGEKNFSESPIRVTIFSDFQCPYCQAVADQAPELIREFKDKISIQYMFYPLDPGCNKNMKGGGHNYACKAAYLAACDTKKFAEVHDHIFKKQSEISNENLNAWADKFGLPKTCFTDSKIHEKIQQTLNAGDKYNLQSTPTIIINGKKLEGLVPTVHLKSMLRSLIK